MEREGWGPGSAGAVDFEARMRRRRFARCILNAETAIASGAFTEARAAIDEARQLVPDAAELALLEARLTREPQSVAVPTHPALPEDLPLMIDLEIGPDEADGPDGFTPDQVDFIPESGELSRSRPLPIPNDDRAVSPILAVVIAFGQLAMMGGVGYGLVHLYLMRSPLEVERMVDVRSAETPQKERAALALEPPPAPPAAKPRVRAGNTATVRVPSLSGRTESRGSRRDTPDRVPQRARALRSAAPAVKSAPPPVTPTPVPTKPAGVPPPVAVVDPGVVNESLATPGPAATTGTVSSQPGSVAPPPPGSSTRSAQVTASADEAQIRSVLTRYESAYNRLDAKAASAVWPGVDSGALDRAFRGLSNQTISLGLCDIFKVGVNGVATCAGKAAWEPKIGSGRQTAERHWSFNLRKNVDGWRIEQIRVR